MDVRVLGPLEVLLNGEPLPLGGPKQRAVLALLAATPGRAVSSDTLIVGVHGPDAPPSALRTIHTYVSNLRHELGDLIIRSGPGYKLVLDDLSTLDSVRFAELAARGSSLVGTAPALAGKVLREALSLWRGHAFADVEAHGSLDSEITRLAELRMSTLESRVEADLAQGVHRELVGELEALCQEYPLRETLRGQHMLALYRCGRQAEALRAYKRTRIDLAEELGIEPTSGLRDLEEMILTQDPQLDLPPAVTIERRAVLTAELGDTWRAETMAERDSVLAHRDAILSANKSRLDVRGNAALAVFPDVASALIAARELAALDMQLAIDQGEVEVSDDRISGPPVNRSLRLAAIANPGQVLVSSEAHSELSASGVGGWSVVSLGNQEIRGLDGRSQLFQLIGGGLADEFGPLRLDRMPQPSPREGWTGPLPGYELRGEIGSNGFSTVNRAYQASVGREVAVRMFNPHLVSDARFVRRFEAVAQRIAAVDHPHLVPLLDYWREPDRAVLVHSLIDGGTLETAVEDTAGELGDPVALVEHVGSSLVVAHQYGLVHGNVDKKNVLLDRAGNPYLADLGVAVMVHGLVAGQGGAPPTAPSDVAGLGTLLGEVAPPDDPLLRKVVARAATADANGYESVADLLVDLRAESAWSPEDAGPSPVRNPYKGLATYESGDDADFFGRDDLIAELVTAVAGKTLTMVVGPSGIGKSSVVNAGLIPALRSGRVSGSETWVYTDMYPGDHPFDNLMTALARVALRPPEPHLEALREGTRTLPEIVGLLLTQSTQMVLVIDQFEELFTQVIEESERKRLLEVLSEVALALDSPVRVVATVRADFFDRPLQYAEFGGAISGGVVTVSAPTRDELAAIVECPAESVGVEVEPGLVDVLIDDAEDEIGGLPLLQHALAELFESRHSDRMTLEEYRSTGGLAAVVGQRADQVYGSLSAEDRDLARQIFLSLVTVDEDVSDVRRRVRRQDLVSLGGRRAVDRVLSAFGDARLLVFDRDPVSRGPTVEVAHEALIMNWARYRHWIDEVRDDLLARRRVEVAAREWLDSDEDAAYLLTGGRLSSAEAWRDRSGMQVGPAETRFLAASRQAANLEHDRAMRARRRVLVGLSSALVLVMVLGAFAWTQRNTAARSTIEAQVRELAAQAHLALGEDPNLAINLALEAYEQSRSLGEVPGEVMTALQTTVQSSRLVAILPEGGAYPFPAWSPDSSSLAVGSSTNPSEVVVYSIDGFADPDRFDAGGRVLKVSFSPDGEHLAVSYDQQATATGLTTQASVPLVGLFEVGSWDKVGEFVGRCCTDWFEFSPDGTKLAALGWTSNSEFTTVWDTDRPEQPRYVYESAWFDSWSADSTEFTAIRSDADAVDIVDAESGTVAETLEMGSASNAADFVPGSDNLALTLPTEAMTRIVSRTGEVVGEYVSPAIHSARPSPDGEQLIQWGSRDDVLITTLGSGDTLQLHGHPGGVDFAEPSPDGRLLAATALSGETMIWDLTDAGPPDLENVSVGGEIWSVEPGHDPSIWNAVGLDDGRAHGIQILPDGSVHVASGSSFVHGYQLTPVASPSGLIGGSGVDGRGRVVDIASGGIVYEVAGGQCGFPAALDDRGELVLIGGGEVCGYGAGGGGVVDMSSGEYLFEVPDLPIYGAFGHPGTPTEDLIVINTGFENEVVEVRRLPGGELVGSLDVTFPFRPFISADGRWATWGSGSSGAFLVDLEAVAAGSSMEDALVFNPLVEAGVTNFTRVGGGFLAAAYSRGVIRVWDIETKELWFTLPENEHVTFTWQFISDDGRYLYYADRSVLRRMPLDPEELASVARARALRSFSVEECERFLPDGTDCSVYET